jgi:hypothetical protein
LIAPRPATSMRYSVAGRTVLIDAYDEWSAKAVFSLFSGWFLSPISESDKENPDLTLRIHCGTVPDLVPPECTSFSIALGGICHTDNQRYFIEFHNSLITFGPGTLAEVDLWVNQPYEVNSSEVAQLISHALSPGLRRCGVFELHSAGVVAPKSSKAIVFAGPSGSGKSTLTSQLASNGWGYLSDDILMLRERNQEVEVSAFRRFFALTDETIAAVNLPGVTSNSIGKKRVTPQDHFQANLIQQATAGTLIFPSITKETRSRLIRLNPATAMSRLIRLCPWASYDKPTSAEHLRILGTLANSTASFDLLAGRDILKSPQQAAELILNATSELAPVL